MTASGWLEQVRTGVEQKRPVLTGYVRRLLSPPLPGDGVLLVGFVAGTVGWPGSYVMARHPEFAPLGVIESIVALWTVLTVGVILIAALYTAPAVRRKRVWLVWGVLNVAALCTNLLGVSGGLPPVLTQYAFWHPWIAVFGVSYLVTAALNWGNPQLRVAERGVYAAAGVAALAALVGSVTNPAVLSQLALIGGALHLLPMGFDIGADLVLILRR